MDIEPVLNSMERFILKKGRPVEKAALVHYRHPSEASAAGLLAELQKFQNPDGGFGKALEPDYRAPHSSVVATNIALCLIDEVLHSVDVRAVPGLSETLDFMLNWLMSVYDAQRHVWPIIPDTGEKDPHAPWWNVGQLDEAFSGFALNPTAETAGWLVRFGTGRTLERGLALAPAILERLRNPQLAASAGALPCLLRLAGIEGFPADFQHELKTQVAAQVLAQVERNPEAWGGYCMKPWQGMPNPQSPGAERSLVLASLDWELGRVRDGAVSPHWSWFGAYPSVWPLAEEDAQSILTLEALKAAEAWQNDSNQLVT